MDKDSKGQRTLEDSSTGLLSAAEGRAPHDAQNVRRSRTRTLFHSLESCFVRGLHPLKLQPGGGFTL